MPGKGQKHQCKKCGGSYYDLGKKQHRCPKCSSKIQEPKQTKRANQEEQTPPDAKPEIEFFYADPELGRLAETVELDRFEVEFPTFREGWHAVAQDAVVDGKLSDAGSTIYFGDFPLNGLKKFLESSRFNGIGPATASELVEKFGAKLLQAICMEHDLDAKPFDLSEELSNKLYGGWAETPESNLLTIALLEFGLTGFQITNALKQFGSDFFVALNQSPFTLARAIPRLSFKNVEDICARVHIVLSKEQRVLAATEHYLAETEDRLRHTSMPDNNTHQRVGEFLQMAIEEVAETLDRLDDAFVYSNRKSRRLISTHRSNLRDGKIVREIKSIKAEAKSRRKRLKFTEKEIETSEGIKLSEEQLDAINTVVNSPVSIITGGPGAGKTTMVQGLVSALKSLGLEIRISAPTGRAAKRIGETPGLSELNPSTIHMFLRRMVADKKKSEFDFMIVDEASMIDVDLMSELLDAMPKGASIALIGDVDQLPPVGPGQPFKDLIESQAVPVARLTGNFRQSSFSDTVKAARNVIKGNVPLLNDSLAETDFAFFECRQQDQARVILDLYFDSMPAKLKVAPQDIQIISPQRPGEVGVLRLNEAIQQRLTAKSKPVFTKKSDSREVPFYIGDKVIQKKNNYDLKVMNGDQGTILRNSGQYLMVEIDGKEISYDGRQRFDLDLAYATTIHSSQGSEYPGVILPITSAHEYMLSRNLIYTAITRGKKQVCVVGEADALKKALNNFSKDFRWTSLVEKLQEAFE